MNSSDMQFECPKCGFKMEEPNWRCPECYYEFEEDVETNSSSAELSSNDTTDNKTKISDLSWIKTILIGSVMGAIVGVSAGFNFGIVGFIISIIVFSFFKEKLKPRSRMIIAIITTIITGGVLSAIIRISNV